MKRMILLVFIVISVAAYSQVIDYNKIILPATAQNISIEERLVQLAWSNHPSVARSNRQIVVAEKNITRVVAGNWLNIVSISFNLNEFTIQGRDNLPNNAFWPRYNINATIPLNKFIVAPTEVRLAKLGLENEKDELNILKIQMRADVLRAYSDYTSNLAMLNIQREYLSDLEAHYKLVDTKFRNGEATINDYNSIRERYDNQRLRLVTAENAFAKARYHLEELIGVSIDEVF